MPIFVYILLGIALLIALLLISRVKVYVCYNDNVQVYARYLFLRFSLFPKKTKVKKEKKRKKKVKPATEVVKQEEKAKEKSIVVKLWEVRSVLLETLKRFLNKLHFRFIKLMARVACSDAAKTALVYAGVNQGISYIIEILRNVSNVEPARCADISVQSDFISQKSEFQCKIQLHIRVYSLIYVGFCAIIDYFKFKSTKEV